MDDRKHSVRKSWKGDCEESLSAETYLSQRDVVEHRCTGKKQNVDPSIASLKYRP